MSAPKEASSAAAKRPVTRRGRAAGMRDCAARPWFRVWVIVLMYLTVRAKWSTDKVQLDGCLVIQLACRPA